MEYLCHKWPRICSICRNHNQVFSSFMAYHQVWNNNNTTSVTHWEGTAYPSGALEFMHDFQLGSCCSIFSFVDRCLSLCPFSFGHCIVYLSLIYGFWVPLWYLWFMASECPFGISDLWLLSAPLVSLIYGFWVPLWYLWFTASECPFGISDLWLLSAPLVSLIYGFWVPLWYLQTFLAALSKLTFEKPRVYLLDV